MKAIRTKIGQGGRINLPTAFRKNLHLEVGDDVILHMENNVIHLTTAEQSLRALQNKVRNYMSATGQNISLADELIAMRRNEAKHE
jgi:bifunctional DNA-binding transcriptional regulator/antitoxin component of YhaV-PrlF toxin-antitoxin module